MFNNKINTAQKVAVVSSFVFPWRAAGNEGKYQAG